MAHLKESFAGSRKKNNPQANNKWDKNIQRLFDLIHSKDPRAFLSWDVIQETMFVNSADYIRQELRCLQEHTEWRRWSEAIKESPVGCPPRYKEYKKSSGNLIHHTYHVAQFESFLGYKASFFDCIFEFGGGYGSMCRLLHNLGYQGRYIIFDFPEFSALQRYYLQSLQIDMTPSRGVSCLSSLEDLQNNLDKTENALCIATWSLSETPLDFRFEIMPLLNKFNNFLFAYQESFEGVDNKTFFSDFVTKRPDIKWENRAIEHLPGSHYLFGRKSA